MRATYSDSLSQRACTSSTWEGPKLGHLDVTRILCPRTRAAVHGAPTSWRRKMGASSCVAAKRRAAQNAARSTPSPVLRKKTRKEGVSPFNVHSPVYKSQGLGWEDNQGSGIRPPLVAIRLCSTMAQKDKGWSGLFHTCLPVQPSGHCLVCLKERMERPSRPPYCGRGGGG